MHIRKQSRKIPRVLPNRARYQSKPRQMRRHNPYGDIVVEGKDHEAEWDDYETQQIHLTPMEGETLYIYLAVSGEAVSAVPVKEVGTNQSLVYFVSKILSGLEKIALALMMAAKKL
ncbi:hypothetical protein L195_g013812 [Trifolium pratense]|uniref:Uncharacterized protein n=1 Tax=Trifolium pratense TaxID=57577 RepID=A0A2K3PP80_TRIPR|nr:hypothetical protein L195_g013812 [Trifolium pratense]